MPANEILTGIIEKLTQRIDELKSQMGELRTQVGELDIKSTTAYNTSASLADTVAALTREVKNLKETRSVTTTTPPTADGTGLPAFVVLDAKPETEYRNYIYFYPKGQ